ncbi:hypothetical protein A7J71_20620 [Achromobacter insolitus]|uniref:hypothetical protein n=1 Tax=Achromobacter insolitus TaxID=217204 RepID=UPI0007C7CDC0|nr:hypothetical protein [Achromobacter insolitus]OAE71656.1 hypothetical protein A7J71_20620 [Achromobacter insolitus]OCZ52937.1 hypothetical protein A7P22_16230 [Achromobacter insolitus]
MSARGEAESSIPNAEGSYNQGVSNAQHYLSGVQASELQQLGEFEAEDAKLKRKFDVAHKKAAIKDALNRKS